MVMVIQTPCLNEVLSKFSIRHHFHLIWDELNISFVKFFNLQIHTAYLMYRISCADLCLCARRFCPFSSQFSCFHDWEIIGWVTAVPPRPPLNTLMMYKSKEEPECQMGSSEAGRCSGTSCCGSGTY